MKEYYWFWLCNIPRIGNAKIRAIMNVFHDAKEVYDANEKLLNCVAGLTEKEIGIIMASKKDNQIYKSYIALQDKNIMFVHAGSKSYPNKLHQIYDYPFGLYYRGKLPDSNVPSVSIIGARNCTNYGKEIARKLGYELSMNGVQVISGMARGIDSYGHRGVIEAGKSTYAILGCGVDICYPQENINLYMDIVEQGGIISEYAPGTQPFPGQFPMRNRIISGLSDIVVVVEAREKSGSLITVDQALEQNKEVMVVPGRIGDRLSEGCNNLIKLGAQMVTDSSDIFANLDHIYAFGDWKTKVTNENNNIVLASLEKIVYARLDLFPKNINTIIEETGIEPQVATKYLLNLELSGLIKEISKNYYVRTS